MKQMVMNDSTPFLPQEIITNILKRLPVKSLLRFRCVCKHWRNLFKTPTFIKEHVNHSAYRNPPLLVGQNDWDDTLYLCLLDSNMRFREFDNTPLIDSLEGLHLVGSCNGLLCIADYNFCPPVPLLWNPATREIKRLPITCDHFSGGWIFGFGFCSTIDDYKIVRFFLIHKVCRVEVYSLSTGSWRNIPFDNIKDMCITSHGVTTNGVVFWFGSKQGVDIMGTDHAHVIVAFDLSTEVFTLIPWPDSLSCTCKLALYNNKLTALFQSRIGYPQYSSISFGVVEEGVIDPSGEKWSSSKKYIHNSRLDLQAVTIWGNQIVCIDSRRPPMENVENLYLINITTNERKLFAIPRRKPCYGVSLFNYVESLVPLGWFETSVISRQAAISTSHGQYFSSPKIVQYIRKRCLVIKARGGGDQIMQAGSILFDFKSSWEKMVLKWAIFI